MPHFLGIDVGTGSARAGMFDRKGTMLARPRHIAWHRARRHRRAILRGHLAACATAIRAAMAEAKLDPRAIGGIGFDATCSLVVLGDGGTPLTVSRSGDPQRNVIVWMDHRAIEQARAHQPDRPCGAAPCRRHHLAGDGDAEDALAEGASAGDLRGGAAVFRSRRLSHLSRQRRAARSICTVTCKWTYLAHERRLG